MSQAAHETSEPEQASAHQIAEAVQKACIEKALRCYEDAQMRGLCAESAWEVAVGALRTLDLEAVLRDIADHTRQESR